MIRSDINFPNRAKNERSNKTIMIYSSTLFKAASIKHSEIASPYPIVKIPNWKMLPAKYDYSYTFWNKNVNANILAVDTKLHIQ